MSSATERARDNGTEVPNAVLQTLVRVRIPDAQCFIGGGRDDAAVVGTNINI
jgi:hypothetical protein